MVCEEAFNIAVNFCIVFSTGGNGTPSFPASRAKKRRAKPGDAMDRTKGRVALIVRTHPETKRQNPADRNSKIQYLPADLL